MLKTRLITSLILIITIGAAFVCLPQLYWGLLMLMISLLASWEWANMSKLNKSASIAYTASIGLFGLWLLILNPQLIQLIVFWSVFAAVLFWLIVAPILLGFNILISNRVVMALLGLVIIIPFALSMIALREINPILLVVFAMTVWIADTAAYFAGKRFGKRKLAPSISPGKTWEGVMGALVATTAFSFLLSYLTHQSYWFVLVFWGVMVLSILGDLFESLIKRQAGVKDSGNLLPGHGGVLDRIDGLTSSLPLVMFLLTLPIYYNLYLYLKAVVFNA
ncbi:phosphatidate cytidylyltransferase [Candidatus Methylopumilus turicensis]|uniref:Phosphatidate cytidylyltransferase n=1 Tax=Candidatus Methylopumilus turicensis TaxID=1581680 RepID=A0A0B7IZE8_9PROT|nr:phosphatidate cytidylyltransferase [Candidatus Methylopumilus turicensis]CEN55896.1 Phosphatidate cytidylyltransferase [Candidatus Methylopumilus turicensis]